MAILYLAENFDKKIVAKVSGVSVKTLNLWIKNFNSSGIDGLIDLSRQGRPRKIAPDENERLKDIIKNPEKAGEVHWTGKKFHGFLRENLGTEIGYSTVMRWRHEENFRLKVPQSWPDRQNEELRIAFVDRVKTWLYDKNIDIWYQDESGFEGDPRPRRRWAQKGEKCKITKNGDHIRMNVSGLVNPRTGEFYALEFTHSDRETFQTFLDHANLDVALNRPRNIMICDNASWHKSKSLNWGRFEPIYLPPYSPDLNPIERLWLLLKAEWFSDYVSKTRERLMARLDQALNWAINRMEDNKSTCRIKQNL
jgi:transposase